MSSLALFEEKHVRRAWNQDEEKWYFSIDDVVQSLTDSANVKDDIKKLRKRDPELDAYRGTHCPLVAMPGAYSRQLKKRLKKEGNETVTKCNTLKMTAAQAGGTIAGNARKELETQSGTRISTQENFKALSKGHPKKTKLTE